MAIVCSPLDSGQTDVMIDRHLRPIAAFGDTERPPEIETPALRQHCYYVL